MDSLKQPDSLVTVKKLSVVCVDVFVCAPLCVQVHTRVVNMNTHTFGIAT